LAVGKGQLAKFARSFFIQSFNHSIIASAFASF